MYIDSRSILQRVGVPHRSPALSLAVVVMLAVLPAGCTGRPGGSPASSASQPTAGNPDRREASAGTPPSDSLPRRVSVGGVELSDDPAADGWKSEVISRRIERRLKKLGGLLASGDVAPGSLAPLVDEAVRSGPLRPAQLRIAYRDGVLAVLRPGDAQPAVPERGIDALAAALAGLREPLGDARDTAVQLKLYDVSRGEEGTISTRAYFQASGRLPWGTVQQNGVWIAQWKDVADEPRLLAVEMTDFEEVAYGQRSGQWFEDCTAAVLSGNAGLGEQLQRGVEHWIRHLQLALGSDNFGHMGLAIGDVNNDGYEDVYLCQPAGLPNKLFLQQPDGTVRDASAAANVDILDRTRSALLVDIDNDGDLDLVLALPVSVLVMSNDGAGRFTLMAEGQVSNVHSMAAADYDLDGDLDIYCCRYAEPTAQERHAGLRLRPVPYWDANNGAPNVLLQNDGNWRFSNVTALVGLEANNRRWSFAAAWEDFDNDGDLDLYVANDFGRNNLYRNDRGYFVDLADEAGAADVGFGMSASWADYDRDGWMDLYVGNMFSAAGGRVTGQREFLSGADHPARGLLRRMSRGNTLLRNLGNGRFADATGQANVGFGRWAWSCNWGDLNNDGWEDLVVANGYITNEKADDL